MRLISVLSVLEMLALKPQNEISNYTEAYLQIHLHNIYVYNILK